MVTSEPRAEYDRSVGQTAALITVVGAVKHYGGVAALDGLSLQVHDGETFGLLGANGAGKTTLMESIVGARQLDGGTISVCGHSPARERLQVARRLSLQPQLSAFYKHLTVRESVETWASFYPSPIDPDVALSDVGLMSEARKAVGKLSGGQLQRLRLAHALVGNTDVVLFDEPTVGLDPIVREQVWQIILNRAGRGAVLLATQMMDEAEALCDRVAIIDHGRLMAEGTVSELLAAYAHEGSISFKSGTDVDVDTLKLLPGVVWASSVKHRGLSTFRLITKDREATQGAIIRKVAWRAEALRARQPTLTDVFLSVVGTTSMQLGEDEE